MNSIVYHLFCLNDGLKRFEKTYKKIQSSGLIDHIGKIHVNCVGQNNINTSRIVSKYNKVVAHTHDYDKSEVTSVNLAKWLAEKDLGGNTLYLHSKGAANKWSQPRESYDIEQKEECIDAWVDFMEYHLIIKFKDCLEYLNQYDTCGCNKVNTNGGMFGFDWESWHYSGNFWWSRNKYLASISYSSRDHYLWSELLFLNGINAKIGKHKELARSIYQWPEILTNKLDKSTYTIPDNLYVHIPKCGGNSVMSILNDNVFTIGHDIRDSHYKYLRDYPLNDNRYVFTFTRNPWDRLVSSYFYLKTGGIIAADKADYSHYLSHYSDFKDMIINWDDMLYNQIHFKPQYEWICDKHGKLLPDHIGKVEDMQQHIDIISKRLGVQQCKLPQKNKSKHKHYTEYYDDETREIVAKKYAKDIEYFGYEFGE